MNTPNRAVALSLCLFSYLGAATPIDRPPRLHPSDPHRLAIGNSTFTLTGYYPALGAFTVETDDLTLYQGMIDTLAANGINYFRMAFTMGQPYANAPNPYLRTGPGQSNDGGPKFDLDRFDQSYFDYWRRIVEYARNRGVVVQLVMMDGWHALEDLVEDNGPGLRWGLPYDYFFSSNNVNTLGLFSTAELFDPGHRVFGYQQALVRKIVDTLGDLPNIVWEIANESGHTDWELRLADVVTAHERSRQFPTHLVMPRDLPGHQFVAGQCDNAPVPAHTDLVAAFRENRVLISDNDCIGADTPDIRRFKAWAALTAGAQINFFHYELVRPQVLASEDAKSGMRYVGLQQKFVQDLGIDLAGMKPADGEVTYGWALGRSGSEYIIYMAGRSTSIPSLTTVSRAVWFNPRDGNSFSAGVGPTFTAPDGQDWVLYVKR
jgi:hypothetical protein